MSLEGKEEKILAEVVFCKGVRAQLRKSDCSSKCEHYGGNRQEPRKVKEAGIEKVVGMDEYVICKYPRLEKVQKIYFFGED